MGTALVPILRVGTGLPGPGRPISKPFDQDIADEIVDRLSNGEFMISICADERIPSVGTVARWERENPAFRMDVALARDIGGQCHVEMAATIAATPHDGRSTLYRSDGTMEMRREDAVQARKLAAWGYLEAAKKLAPGRFSDRPLVGDGATINNVTVNNVTLENTPQEAAEIYSDKLKSIG